jgi:prolyl oligopeptidase
MRLHISILAASIALMACSESHHEAPAESLAGTSEGIQTDAPAYPDSARIEHMDSYHGVDVADPYRWLEDDVRENADVRNWVDAQNEVTFAYLAGIPEREVIKQRISELWDYEKFGIPVKEGGHYFYDYNDGLQNQDLIYIQSSLEAEPELLVDPNSWSDDGTVAMASYFPGPGGKYMAFLVQDGGSDWRTGMVMNIETRAELDDQLNWLKFTEISWSRDGSGFYYSRYPSPESGEQFQQLNMNQAVYFHRLGTTQEEDKLIYARPDHPDWGFSAKVTDDGAYLVITTWKGTDDRYQIVYQNLDKGESGPVMLIEGFDHDYTLVGSVGSELFQKSPDRD